MDADRMHALYDAKKRGVVSLICLRFFLVLSDTPAKMWYSHRRGSV